ncbi:AAA family ATPase [Lebetimonas sp. JS032]|uniref:AAA family ATPase n=1 Tax=Lebetimonas sp. JS032 TaxID=990070 RepID=UPI00046749FE|nr:AAA family ATPase [Lebetimonas sp. JS032]
MITKIKLHKTASYADVVEIEPKAINYFFGSNYPHCNLEWATSPIDVFIYNKQFVQDSFSQSNAIKGIFTLGKDATGIQKFIEEANAKIGDFKNKIEGLNKSIETQEEKLSKKRDDGALKKKYEAYFKPAFKGFMGSAKDFFNKCISEQKNSSDLLDEKEIIENT